MKNEKVVHMMFRKRGSCDELDVKQQEARDFLAANPLPRSPLREAMAHIGIKGPARLRVVASNSDPDFVRSKSDFEIAEEKRREERKQPGKRWCPPETRYLKHKGKWVEVVTPGEFY